MQNLNTEEYWDGVYRLECEAGELEGGKRDYGPIHEAIVEVVPAGATVLDVACGLGILCRKIVTRRPETSVVGVDFSGYTIARNNERDAHLPIEYRQVDVRTELSGVGRVFDVVTMCEVLEHLTEPERVVADAMALLRPAGLFVLTCPHDDEIEGPEHLRLWGHDQVFHLLAPYSDRVTFVHFPPPYFSPWLMAYLTKSGGG
jgi:2-polyprenyl-3-methyl-5-hydroxy-6-metoxy-1,4-benzoquinol methylase